MELCEKTLSPRDMLYSLIRKVKYRVKKQLAPGLPDSGLTRREFGSYHTHHCDKKIGEETENQQLFLDPSELKSQSNFCFPNWRQTGRYRNTTETFTKRSTKVENPNCN